VIDEGYYEKEARENGKYYPGDAVFGSAGHGHHDGEIDEYNGIYFVDGTLTISGRYRGKAVIVARKIIIDGNLPANTPADLLTLISLSDVDLKNNEVRALVVAAGVFLAQGGAELHGGLLVQNIEVSGNVGIYCNPELAAQNPLPGLSFGSGGVKIESWKEQFPVVS
jgi:hypothetical protein